jgi:hypothetical protein
MWRGADRSIDSNPDTSTQVQEAGDDHEAQILRGDTNYYTMAESASVFEISLHLEMTSLE